MTSQDDARSKILARRAAFVAAALAGLSIAGGCAAKAQICLDPALDDAMPPDDAETPDGDASPQVCLSPLDDASPPVDTGPEVCLSPMVDAGEHDDAAPQPCLDLPGDAMVPDDDAAPQVCLSPPFDDAP